MTYFIRILCGFSCILLVFSQNIRIVENSRKLPSNSPILKIRCIHKPSNISSVIIEFSPSLIKGEDYEILSNTYEIPYDYLHHSSSRNATEVIQLKLLDNKRWADLSSTKSSQVQLFLAKLAINDPSNVVFIGPVRIATIIGPKTNCQKIPLLPGSSRALTNLLSEIISTCAGSRIHYSKRLNRRLWNSYSLLDLIPPVFLIDGSDQTRDMAAKSVDAFLAAHAVLEIAWEPIYPNDPDWWVLVPRPKGMPGHLFALLDAVQWRHPLVARSEAYYRNHRNCTTDADGVKHCVPGCEGTKLLRFTASGYNADTRHLAFALSHTLSINTPFQAAPLRLGYRLSPPQWGSTLGWSYTFQGCESNFLDCFFLAHSPCNQVDVDVEEDKSIHYISPERVMTRDESTISPSWFETVMGVGVDQPDHSIGKYNAQPSEHIMYTYLFRPNYRIRQEVQRRVDSFGLEKDSCATMHVRRGDSVMHRNQGRAYLEIYAYVQAARPFLEAMDVYTIMLFTDSLAAIEEAQRCETEHPEVCRGIKFKFVNKKRWRGAEGGWENPFPSGNATEEFYIIQNEFSLAQKCSFAILGNSGYGDLLYSHMCCNFPLAPRGSLPTRCVCPPKVQLTQWGFNCEDGNKILCNDQDVGGNIHKRLDDPENMLGANYSFTKNAFRANPTVTYNAPGYKPYEFRLQEMESKKGAIDSYVSSALGDICRFRKTIDSHYDFC